MYKEGNQPQDPHQNPTFSLNSLDQIRQQLTDFQLNHRVQMEDLLIQVKKQVQTDCEEKTMEEIAGQSVQCLKTVWQKNAELSTNVLAIINLTIRIIDYASQQQIQNSHQHQALIQEIEELRQANQFLQSRNGFIQLNVEQLGQRLQQAQGELNKFVENQAESEPRISMAVGQQYEIMKLQDQVEQLKRQIYSMKSVNYSQRSLISSQRKSIQAPVDQISIQNIQQDFHMKIQQLQRENNALRHQIRDIHQHYESQRVIALNFDKKQETKLRKRVQSFMKQPSQSQQYQQPQRNLFQVLSTSIISHDTSKTNLQPISRQMSREPSSSTLQVTLQKLSNQLSHKSIEFRPLIQHFSLKRLEEAQEIQQTKPTEESQIIFDQVGVNTQFEQRKSQNFTQIIDKSIKNGIFWCKSWLQWCKQVTVSKRIKRNTLKANLFVKIQ